jgi:Fe-S cluster assembly protein SufD
MSAVARSSAPDFGAHFLTGGQNAQAQLPAAGGALAQLRAAGLAALETASWPTAKTESWKYSRLTKLLEPAFIAPTAASSAPFSSALPEGVTLRPLSRLDAVPEALALSGEAFDALNAALAPEAYELVVAPGIVVPEPLQLDLMQQGTSQSVRFALRLGAGSQLTLVERQSGEAEALFSLVGSITLETGAQLHHRRLHMAAGSGRWLAQHAVQVGPGAHYDLLLAQRGAAFRRNELSINLLGPGASVAVQGASLTDGAEHLDTQLAMNHWEPQGTSTQRFRALAAGQSKSTLNGRIHILPGAQKSDAAFNVRSLLLSRGAELNAKPELEIYADDVACAHGATVGELDPGAVFYLRSRGLSEQAARAALAYAHLATVLDSMEGEALAEPLAAEFKGAFDAAF